MTWTSESCDHLQLRLGAGQTAMALASPNGGVDLCALLGQPPTRHAILEIYTARGSETVAAFRCASGMVELVRGLNGTTARDWPPGACVRTVQIVEAPLTDPEETPAGGADPFAGLTVCGALTLDLSQPGGPTLCLAPTGVVAGEYGGGRLRVNEFGQITYLSHDFPVGSLPVFDPCGCIGGSGGGGGPTGDPVAADAVMYTSQLGACFALSGTVQSALRSLDAALCASVSEVATVVHAVQAGPGVNVTGSVNATVSLEEIYPAGLSVGGLVTDVHGRVLSYAPPTIAGETLVGESPVSAVRAVGGAWTISVANASMTAVGVVSLAPISGLDNPPSISSTAAITWSFLQEWWSRSQSFLCGISSTPVVSREQRSTASVLVCEGSTGLPRYPLTELLDAAGAPFARLVVADGIQTVFDNIASVTAVPDGFAVVFAAAAPRAFHVSATAYDLLALPVISAVTPSGFTLKWRTTADAALVVPLWSAVVILGDG